ncbi:MAG: protein jag [Lachnospiraceae bacterium]|jgi:spoIIIJ-associated protein|nr:protein jag [Lachnospiraceae bacterium]
MEYKEVSAKTVDDAVLEAAIQFGTTRDNIAYEVIAQGSAGFLGIGSKKAVIKAHVRTEEEIQASKKAEKEVEKILERVNEKAEEKPVIPQPKKEPVKEIKKEVKKETVPAKDKPVKAERAEEPKKEEKPEKKPIHIDTEPVKEFLDKVFAAMDMKVRITITSSSKEHEISVELEGDDMGVLIGKRGQTLDSLQYLASLVANKSSEDYIRVKVDTENYRERRRATLENLAKNISHKVKRTRKPVSLEPMNPYERRIIHSALQNDKFVCTHSEGEEPYRKVVVTLREGVRPDNNYNGRNRNRYNRNYKKKER